MLLVPVSAQAQFKNGLNQLDSAVGPSSRAGLQRELTPAVATIVTAALSLVGTIFLLLTIYGGIRWMLARGDEGEIEKGKEIIKAAIIGLVIVMSAYAITAFVGSRLSAGGSGEAEKASITTEAQCQNYSGVCSQNCSDSTISLGSCTDRSDGATVCCAGPVR